MLLLHANRPVSADRLVDAIWATEVPHNVRNLLQTCVHRLRKRLHQASAGQSLIATEPAGYRITVDPKDLDLYEFRRLVGEARAAATAGNHHDAKVGYRAALDRWRGPVLAGIDSDPIRAAAASLDEERVQALEECLHSELAAGGAGELVAELTDLVARHPHREGLQRALMLALYRAGRQADALATYRHARQLLRDELGTEPSAELQQLHHAMLRREPTLDVRLPSGPTTARSSPKPRELPADVAGFTGRVEALKALDELQSSRDALTGPVVISAIAGTAGVGKTALAIHWAHHVKDRFPDGQLYVNLRGFDHAQPTTPADALTRLLSALGVTGQDVPHDLEERAARYRSELADRRMLIVLDNAGSVDQVRPLLPGTGSTMVVVTSRSSLAALVAVHGAHRLELDLLAPAEAIALLRRLVGPRVDEAPEAAATLIDQCARLPLALRVAAELAASRPSIPLADLAAELGDRQRRLDLLDGGGDPHAAVRTVFSWSIQHLPPDTVTTFRLLGLHPGPDATPYAVAALTDTSVEAARRRLDLLARAHLVQPTGLDRCGMHDLLRVYAAELAGSHDTDQTRHASLSRLLDYYRHTASVAIRHAYPYEREQRPAVLPVATPTPDLLDPARAADLLDVELPNLLATARYAADNGWPTHILDLSGILSRHLVIRGRYDDAETLHRQALATARGTGRRAGELTALIGLGNIHQLRGQPEQAADCHGQALRVARTVGDRARELEALIGLGRDHRLECRYEKAVDCFGQALEIARTIGDRARELDALVGLGTIHLTQRRLERAAECFARALEIGRTIGHRTGELAALAGHGHVHRQEGRYELAAGYFEQALEIARGTGYRAGELTALGSLGHTYRLQGRYELAVERWEQSLEIARTTGYRSGVVTALIGLGHTYRQWGRYEQATAYYQQFLDLKSGHRHHEFDAWQGLGRVQHATGHPGAALDHHQQAYLLAVELGNPADQARAHDGLAHAYEALGQPEQARQHWQTALDILTRLGVDHTEEPEANTAAIRAHLAALAAPPEPSRATGRP
jgi:tetratricopeptide (TPR) repeat protein